MSHNVRPPDILLVTPPITHAPNLGETRIKREVFLDARDQNLSGNEDSNVGMVEETPGLGHRDNERAFMHLD